MDYALPVQADPVRAASGTMKDVECKVCSLWIQACDFQNHCKSKRHVLLAVPTNALAFKNWRAHTGSDSIKAMRDSSAGLEGWATVDQALPVQGLPRPSPLPPTQLDAPHGQRSANQSPDPPASPGTALTDDLRSTEVADLDDSHPGRGPDRELLQLQTPLGTDGLPLCFTIESPLRVMVPWWLQVKKTGLPAARSGNIATHEL